MSITAQTEKVNTFIYLLRISSDNSRLHQGFFQVGQISLLVYKWSITCLFTIEASGKNSPGAPTVLYMRDIFRTLYIRVCDRFEGNRFSVNIWPLNTLNSRTRYVSSLTLHCMNFPSAARSEFLERNCFWFLNWCCRKQFLGVTKQKTHRDLISCSNGNKWQIKTHCLEK